MPLTARTPLTLILTLVLTLTLILVLTLTSTLILTLARRLVLCQNRNPKSKINRKGSGQECPPHTALAALTSPGSTPNITP